ncbi:hypothetical protein RJ55_03219 [Drechmeria coniospora]|nr:hypothetical protein RJ55_03219 [Drechmeria coniospora]
MASGLGNRAFLAKIDKLRELNVGSMIPLPQLVVVGDQSSGKSSVLESMTGFSFPRAAGLCTRYATQITCHRHPIKSVRVSIIPRPDADDTLKSQLLEFERCTTELDNDALTEIFHEANLAMGIRMTADDKKDGLAAFSQDILKIEVHGPDQSHMTVIDVPGIFRVPTAGLTAEADIVLVENMVKSYMSNRRTIILAVMPCNVDIATQEILKLAEAADPVGLRTMGVLTKPDLATESATKEAVIDLLAGNRSNLKLGYYVVKNRGADDNTSTLVQRADDEKAFFMGSPWPCVQERCGIAALKGRLRHLLMKISKQEIPNVKFDIEQRLHRCKDKLATMGPTRGDENSQRLYLGKLANKFQAIAQAALNGYYISDNIFEEMPDLKLITRIIKLNEVFSNTLWTSGHSWPFEPTEQDKDGKDNDGDSDNNEDLLGDASKDTPFRVPIKDYPEIHGIISTKEKQKLHEPLLGLSGGNLIDRIRDVYETSRGPEIGTFGGNVLSTVFIYQSAKWESMAMSHAANAVTLVHDFISRLIRHLCPEKNVREALWDDILMKKLHERYGVAMDHTRFLLTIERGGRPTTFNHYFSANLQQRRVRRTLKPMMQKATWNSQNQKWISLHDVDKCVTGKNNGQQVCEDILDTLVSYDKVARKRFVDAVCQQVVAYHLLDGDESPLKVFSTDLIMSLSHDELDAIAGEDEESKGQRHSLGREIESLEAALKVLRA